MNIERAKKIAGWFVAGALAAVGLGILLGVFVMWLWNWLMTALFGLPAITYWQAVGILVLCHLLFKGHGNHPYHDSHDRHLSAFRGRVKNMMHGDGKETAPGAAAGGGTPSSGPGAAGEAE
jgi:hypothetical protein